MRIFSMILPLVTLAIPLYLNVQPTTTDLSEREIQQTRTNLLLNPEFTNNYSFESIESSNSNFLGRGREGIVYLARDKKLNELMAIKVKCEKSPDIHPYDGAKEVEAVKLFSAATGYKFEAINYSGFNAKSFIKGDSLEKVMKSNELFDGSNKSNVMLKQLRFLFKLLIKGKLYFTDIAPENLIYDGEKFYIIDLRPFDQYETEAQTRSAYSYQIFASEIAWSQERWYDPERLQEGRTIFLNLMGSLLSN